MTDDVPSEKGEGDLKEEAAPGMQADGEQNGTVLNPEAEKSLPLLTPKQYHTTPVVGLGGSAGSIQALLSFFQEMPPDLGIAFVVILHLSPEHGSSLPALIQRVTTMPAVPVLDSVHVKANSVYIIPPGKSLASADGHLRVTDMHPLRGKRVVVDLFFRTLADTHGPNSAAIVLSGADSDGAIGIKRIKEAGGLTIAQDPDEAEHNSMPRAAIQTGTVDWVLRVAQMPARLISYYSIAERLRLPPEDGPSPTQADAPAPSESEAALREVLRFLRTRTGRDFSYYKRATILRRLSRRMQVNGIDDLTGYLSHLRTHPGESGTLLQDLLISVTNFFRDKDGFDELAGHIPELFEGKGPNDCVRAWVPACASGEEAYSVAILLAEHARTMDAPPSIQVFATDLDEEAIATGRAAAYPLTISADVSEERLRRYFMADHRGYRVRQELRETVLFACHDLLKDSPFSRMDLISCRNLLIYLNREAQTRAFDVFAFALWPKGKLFLGSSESIDDGSALFSAVDKKHRIYMHRATPRSAFPMPAGQGVLSRALQLQDQMRARPAFADPIGRLPRLEPSAVPEEAERIPWSELHLSMIERFAPPSLVVNADHEVVHLSRSAGQYLRIGSGELKRNLLDLINPMLRVELRVALFNAAQTNGPVDIPRVRMEIGGEAKMINIRVRPAADLAPGFLLVVFEPEGTAEVEPPRVVRADADSVTRQMEREMETIKSQLKNTVEQYEGSTEELKASNEELRSATEELETSREELQSINEELTTVNQELKSKLDELAHANSDLHNLMVSTAIPTVFLDRELCIMRYTPSAVEIFRFIPSDVGRPLKDLRRRLHYPQLEEDAHAVLTRLIPVEREISDETGARCYLTRLLPYRTTEDRVGGVVLTLVDITESKRAAAEAKDAAEALKKSESRFRALVTQAKAGIIEGSVDRRYTYVNDRFCEIVGRSAEEVLGRHFQEINLAEDYERTEPLLARMIQTGEPFDTETRFLRPDGTMVWALKSVAPMFDGGKVTGVSAVVIDIDSKKQGEIALQRSEQQNRIALDAAKMAAWDYDLRTGMVVWNERHFLMLGVPYDGKIKTVAEFMSFVHPEDAKMIADKLQEAAESGGYEAEFRIVRRDTGEARWMNGFGRAVNREGGKVVRLSGVMFDITDRKMAEEGLRASEKRLSAIFTQASAGLCEITLAGRFERVNDAFCHAVGRSREELLSLTLAEVVHPDDLTGVLSAYERMLDRGVEVSLDMRFARPDGKLLWASSSFTRLQDSTGEATCVLGVIVDLTERKQAMEEVEQSRADLWAALLENEKVREELEAAGKAKDHFLAVLSHELRTPLTPVLMATRILERRKDLLPEVRESLDMIRRNVQIEAQFIDDLLDVTRIERGKLEISREPVNLHTVLKQAIAIGEADRNERRQKLTVTEEATRFEVTGDATRLQQVMWNLLKNSSKFSPEEGEIRVRTWNEAGSVLVSFADNGIGIEQEAMQMIFDPFRQENRDVTRRFGGLGLGLAIAKATMETHGGTLRAESGGRNMGATFIMCLPLAE